VIEVDQSQSDFLTKERVNGELLSDRLARSRPSVEEALRYAIEIGSILSKAHRHGQVHGSLSPHSIALTTRGVRILNAVPDERAAAYRSPEQLQGEPADARSDVFAYGALLYELATGARAFPASGEELEREILAKTPREENSPAYQLMEPVIASCLHKDPAERKQRIHNAVIELKFGALARRMSAARASSRLSRKAALRAPRSSNLAAPLESGGLRSQMWVLAAVVGLVLIVGMAVAAAWLLYQRVAARSASAAGLFAFRMELPANTRNPEMPAVSPDGTMVAFSAVGPEGQRTLWLRPLNELRYQTIAGTEGASSPFWSPDSRYIGFFANHALKKVERGGGVVESICPAESIAGGGAWNRDGTILFAPSLADGLWRVPAVANSKPEPALALRTDKTQSAFLWPQFLPDAKHFLFFVQTDSAKDTGVYAGTLGKTDYQLLFPSDTNAVFSSREGGKKGFLLFMHDRTVMGQPFDSSQLKLLGDPMPVVEDVGVRGSISLAPISVSAGGILVYQIVGSPTRQVVWVDRTGKPLAAVKDPGEWGEPRISPDGNRAVVAKLGVDGDQADLWIIDAAGGATPLTETPLIHEGSPVWSPTGATVAFRASGAGGGSFDIYAKPANASGKLELLLRGEYPKNPSDWSHDGRYILFNTINPGTRGDLWALSLPDKHAGPVLGTINNEGYGAVSPDGRWMAFQSDESGRADVFVQRFVGINGSTQRHFPVSQTGGGHPRWRADGKELYYITPGGRIMAVTVHSGGGDTLQFDPPQLLFQTNRLPKKWNLFDASPDGERFLLNVPIELAGANSLAVVTNWMDMLRQ
jgi:Tol biopolymer transport system component